MKKCVNCNNELQSEDIYCRHCGCKVMKNSYYLICNIIIVILTITIILLIALFIASFLMK